MPQFDKITFLNQIIWLFFFFFNVYFLTLKIFLPRIAFILKLREKKMSKGTVLLNKFPFEINQNQMNLNLLWETNLNLFKTIQYVFKQKFTNWVFLKKEILITLIFVEKNLYFFFFTKFLLSFFLNSIFFLSLFNFKFNFLKKIQINNIFKI